jgi:hypothetical protein
MMDFGSCIALACMLLVCALLVYGSRLAEIRHNQANPDEDPCREEKFDDEDSE